MHAGGICMLAADACMLGSMQLQMHATDAVTMQSKMQWSKWPGARAVAVALFIVMLYLRIRVMKI